VKEVLASEEDDKPWWMKELALQAAARNPEDPVDEPSLH
jgi:hypothetical protein